MSFRDIAKLVRAEAAKLGIKTPMAQLNDAIAYAFFDRSYSSALAAEAKGQLESLPTVPPHLVAAAEQFRVDAYPFGRAIAAAITHEPATPYRNATRIGLEWLHAKFRADIGALFRREFEDLTTAENMRCIIADPHLERMVELAFETYLLCEASFRVNNIKKKAVDLMLGPAGPHLDEAQREYLQRAAAAPLRLYRIEKSVPGFNATLREIGTATPQPALVLHGWEATHPELQGAAVGARLIEENGRMRILGAGLPFGGTFAIRVADAIRPLEDPASISREIRRAWFAEFLLPRPKIVDEAGDPVVLIEDLYVCLKRDELIARLDSAPSVHGDPEFGWSLVEHRDDGSARPRCGIHFDKKDPDTLIVFYSTERRAQDLRPWFEQLSQGCVRFHNRRTQDAATLERPENWRMPRSDVPPDRATQAVEEALHASYGNWADAPLPALDNITPREMLRRPGGEVRVRELLGLYEANELRLASIQHRPPASLTFMYEAVGLSRQA